jgi:hypothetical protein
MERWLGWLYLAIVVAVAILILRLTLSNKLKRGWARSLLQLTGALLSIPFALLTCISLLMIGCSFESPLAGSPDHRHVARVQVLDGGALGGSASVAVRHSWSPVWTNAYMGDGMKLRDGSFEPELKWVDNSNLLILYPNGYASSFCREQVGEVLIKCQVKKTSKESF